MFFLYDNGETGHQIWWEGVVELKDRSVCEFCQIYNNFTMNKSDPKFRRFANLQGHLQKLSSNFFLGYQPKFWKVIDNGTKIGYSNEPDQPIRAENIFLIKECFASQASGDTIFELRTRDKVFTLKAPNEEQRTDWIKGLTFLKKVLNNQIKLKNQVSPTETTIASRSDKLKIKTPKIQTSLPVTTEKSRVYQPEDLMPDTNIESDLVEELIKYLPQKCVKYYTLLTNLKVKSQGLFLNSMSSSTYLLISPKSLYPEIYIGEDNLTNVSLPPWLEVNYFYKILNINTKQKKKQVFHTSKIIDIQEGTQEFSIKINTGQVIYEFFTDTIEQRQCLKNCLQLAVDNAEEVIINGKTSKKNFDKLIDLHETKLPQFQKQVKEIIQSFLKNDSDRKFQPSELFQFMDNSMKFLQEFITILEHKKKNKDHVILDMLKLFHEEVKTQSKLTWDSSFFGIKGIQILNMLKKLSEYYEMMKNFIKSPQFLEGMKQLSKIYVRESWKNFESIIMSIVEQQKNKNIFQDQECEYIQTYGVTDLFKFIYSVFDLAYPHWKNKIHLHNVNRLTQRALQVFVNELRSMIDEEVISEQQMIGLANNYFCFSDYVKEFSTEKFKDLVDKTHEPYQKIIASYREVSMIILQKIVHTIGISIENYCQKCTIQTLKTQALQQIIVKSLHPIQKLLHMAFLSKLNQKLAKQVQLKICQVVMQQTKLKKRVKLSEIIRCVRELKVNLNKVFDNISKNHTNIDKKMKELEIILSYDLVSDIEEVIISSTDPLRRIYLKILQLREDFYDGSVLFKVMSQHSSTVEENPQINKAPRKRRGSIDLINREKHATISKQYFMEQIMDSDENQNEERSVSQTKKGTEGSKFISEGQLIKGKRNKKVWEKSYFRLKNGFLYNFASADSDRCRNAIQIKNITKIDVLNKQKPSFLLTYKTLNKQKEIKLKAESIELRERWVNSLQMQKKRMLNEEQVKKKSIKYKQTQNGNGRKKYQMIIDYEELEKGKDYFSYST